LCLIAQTSKANAQDVPPAKLEGPTFSRSNPPPGVSFPPAPPANFNSLTASDSELKAFGFPSRPDSGKQSVAYAHWSKMAAASKTRVQPAVRQTNIRHRPARILNAAKAANSSKPAATQENDAYSYNWSGSVVVDWNAPFFEVNAEVEAECVVPLVQQQPGVCTGGWQYSSHWGGFDGWGTSDVLQAGSEADAYCDSNGTAMEHGLWYEWYPYPSTFINLTVRGGDVIL
jgi:hypothetical protein